jgi:N-acetylglutamate synthase-like GNAT family acetyltransferase
VLVSLANGLNQLPLAKAAYGTTQDYTLFWVDHLLSILSSAIFFGMMILSLWLAGHWLSKQVWLRQDRILSRRGDRWHNLALSGWQGLMLAFIHGGYVVVFYLVATRLLGGWTPLAPDYTDAYATPLPFLGAVEAGLLPALWEELMFRLGLIAAVVWLARTFTRLPERAVRLATLLVAGILWGFAHLSYIRDPYYLRGIELTLGGIVYGLFFLRFGLATTIVAHFAYNAGLVALPLLRSGDPGFVASGAVVVCVMLAPMAPWLARVAKRRLCGQGRDRDAPRIREAGTQDVAPLAALPICGVEWEALVDRPDVVVLCLEAAHEVVGVAAGSVTSDAGGQVLALYVAPSWRRRYWGSELVDVLRRRLEELGAQSIERQISLDNKSESAFWNSQGWNRAQMTLRWPPRPRTLPNWREVLRQLKPRR